MLYSKESLHLFQGPSRTATLNFDDKIINFVSAENQCEYPHCDKMTWSGKYTVQLIEDMKTLQEMYLCHEHYQTLMIKNKVRWDIMLRKSDLKKSKNQ